MQGRRWQPRSRHSKPWWQHVSSPPTSESMRTACVIKHHFNSHCCPYRPYSCLLSTTPQQVDLLCNTIRYRIRPIHNVYGRGRFQRERLGTAFSKLFSQWERRSQEFNSSLISRYTFCEHAAIYAIIRNSPYSI